MALSGADPEAARRRRSTLNPLTLLAQHAAATRLARRFVRPDCIPEKAKDDALHLALCAIYGIAPGAIPAKATDDAAHIAICAVNSIPYLLTWNFKHIANAEIRLKLDYLCAINGYKLPTICTPEEL